MTSFSIAFVAYTPWSARATIPPDGRLLAEVIRWIDLRDITVDGLGSKTITVTTTGARACSILERTFSRWYPFAPVDRQWETGETKGSVPE